MLEGLESLREGVRQRLDSLEEQARRRSEAALGPSGRERELEARIAELEEALARARDEAVRREDEGREAIEQLEQDRRQLALAWERLEQEQLALSRASLGASARAPLAPVPAPAPTAAPRIEVSSQAPNPVAEEILKQFQTLRRDVRRNARELKRD